jgi:2-polyprenyl-6-methoxyphenol hydroxylase-like FAD-dependent oxidoreductase
LDVERSISTLTLSSFLIERAPHFREGGYMIDFWGVGFDVAEKMNLLPRLRQVGYNFNRIKFLDEQGRTRSELGERVFRGALGERFISLQRGDLARAIFDTIAGKIDIVFDDSITGIRQTARCGTFRCEFWFHSSTNEFFFS